MKEIEQVKFPLLSIIDLRGNKIESIEGFNKIQAPALQILYFSTYCPKLDGNNLNKLTEVKKFNYARLDQINFCSYVLIQPSTK